jgi:hypothetical protein
MLRLTGDRALKLMSLQAVRPVIETAQKIAAEVCDVRSGNHDWLDDLGVHGRTVIASEALTLAGVTHYLYRVRENSGIAISSYDYPDGDGKQGFMLFSTGQWAPSKTNTMDNVPLRPYLISSTPKEIDRSLHRQVQKQEAGVAAFGIDGDAFLAGQTPTRAAADRAATAIMRLYTPAVGLEAMVEPLYQDFGAQRFDFQPHTVAVTGSRNLVFA